MENQLKIYQVRHNDAETIDEVLASFDSKEKAECFLTRFKTTPKDFGIIEISLNPNYIVNKLADPYLVSLRGRENDPRELEIYDYIEEAELAEKEGYKIDFYPGKDKYTGYFEVMLFAASEEEALTKAIKKRDDVIASGEWDKAYQESIESKE